MALPFCSKPHVMCGRAGGGCIQAKDCELWNVFTFRLGVVLIPLGKSDALSDSGIPTATKSLQ